MRNRIWSGYLLWLYLPLHFPDMFFVDTRSEAISSDDF